MLEVIRLDLADPRLWKTAMTTTSLRALSLRERLAVPRFTDNLFVIAGDINEHVPFTLDASEEECSFVFWAEGMEENILKSLKLIGMPVDEEGGMIIAMKELIGPVVAVCLWGTAHQGQTAVVINDNHNACCWINSRGGCRNVIAQYLIFVLTRAKTRSELDIFAAYVNTKRNSVADQGTRVLTGLTSGAEAADRVNEYLAWAMNALPGYSVEDWADYVEDLLLQAENQSTLELWHEPIPPSAQVKRAAGRNPRAGPASAPPNKGRIL